MIKVILIFFLIFGETKFDKYKNLLLEELNILEVLQDLEYTIEEIKQNKKVLKGEIESLKQEIEALKAKIDDIKANLKEKTEVLKKSMKFILAVHKRLKVIYFLSEDQQIRLLKTKRYFKKLLNINRTLLQKYSLELSILNKNLNLYNKKMKRFNDLKKQYDELIKKYEESIKTKKSILSRIQNEKSIFLKYHKELNKVYQKLSIKIRKFKRWQQKKYNFAKTKGQLLYPVSPSKIIIPYGERINRKFKTVTFHRGVSFKIRNPKTNPVKVRAVYYGRVVFVGRIEGYGRVVILDHSKGYHTLYGNLSKILVKKGDIVASRQTIGLYDVNYEKEGKYLYFELRKNGDSINPSKWFRK